MSLDTSLEGLRRMWQLSREVDTTIEQAVAAARADGATWEQVGETLGMTKQGAHYRFGRIAIEHDEEGEPVP